MEQDNKRKLRELKRVIKRAGSKHRRRDLKRQLRDDPAEAHLGEENFGRHRSEDIHATGDGPERPAEPG